MEQNETVTEKVKITVSKMAKQLDALSAQCKTYHCAIVDQIEDHNKLIEEQAIIDDHEDKVGELMERLEDLVY